MVQVDIVWSYAFGATFAAAACRQLATESKPFNNKHFAFLQTFLGVFFGPAGLFLLWQFPHWETMQVAQTHTDIPAWLVVVFGVTNVSQGILGFAVGYHLARRGRYYAAHANWMVAWTLFWFVLVSGWDTTGWQRFLYDPTMAGGMPWAPGKHHGLAFFTSNVFQSLFIMGVFFTPMLIYGISGINYLGLRSDPVLKGKRLPRLIWLLIVGFGTMFGVTLAIAIGAALLVQQAVSFTGSMLMGYIFGVAASIVLGYLLVFKRGGPMHWLARQLYVSEPK
jgi:hypothetical protein